MEDIEKDAVELADDLIHFINESPTAYHAGQSVKHILNECGFVQLDESEAWTLEAGKEYFVERDSSAVVAFRVGNKPAAEAGFKLVGAHTDSPGLKLKTDSERIVNGCAQVGVEVYGGPIMNTWLDRNLAIAGKVMIKQDDVYVTELVNICDPVATIPNLAIHLNRDVNKGVELNKQRHLPALLGCVGDEEDDILKGLVADEFDIEIDQIGEMELFLYDYNSAEFSGIDESLISSARIDNLAMCHAITVSLCDADESDATAVGVYFDHEEIGSQTAQGADSNFVKNILERIVAVQGGTREDMFRALANSFMISADGAHAVHPNFADKHDKAHAPEINGGPVIKLSANMRYTTTAESASYFIELCEKANVPYQKIINRSDIPSGSTIGPVCASVLGVTSVDVGNAMWAMHSIREPAGVYDHYYMTEVLKEFYS